MQLCAPPSVAGYAMILARHVAIIRERPNYHVARRSSKSMYDNEDQVMRRWMLHDNISRKGYGNALIGRYGGCFEEGYKDVYDDKAYHAKGLDAPAKYAPTLEVRKGQCMVPKRPAKYGKVEVSKIE